MPPKPDYDQTLTIPHPIILPRQSGMMSLRYQGRAMSCRLHEKDIALLHELAAEVGIPMTTLMRWFIVHCMQQMFKIHQQRDVEIRP